MKVARAFLPPGYNSKARALLQKPNSPQLCPIGPSHRNKQAVVGIRLFPAQMETLGPHVASVVFTRRSGAKAGRPISKPQLRAPVQSPPRPSPPTGLSFPLPSGLQLSLWPLLLCIWPCFCITHTASPQPLPTKPLAKALGSSGFGSRWLISGMQATQGPQDPGTGFRTLS